MPTTDIDRDAIELTLVLRMMIGLHTLSLCSVRRSFLNGCSSCRIERGRAGLMHVHIEDPRCVQVIKDHSVAVGIGPIFNLVQEAQWEQTLFNQADQVCHVPDIADGPGSWSSHGFQADRQLHPDGNMAYPMRVGRILRPVPASKSSPLSEVCFCPCAQVFPVCICSMWTPLTAWSIGKLNLHVLLV